MSIPIVRMFHEEISTLIDTFSTKRLETPWRERRSLIVILRAVPGSGKSTFAAFVKMYAESIGLEAQICNADSYFMTLQGYKYDSQSIPAAHARSQAYCLEALARGVPVVIIDNTNVTRREWSPYSRMAQDGGHALCRVAFVTDLDAQALAARSWHEIPLRKLQERMRLFLQDHEIYAPHYQVTVRTDPFIAQDDEESTLNHPIERMFFTEIADKLDEFKLRREKATADGNNFDAHKSCVFILRGLPGCGKSTFALQATIFARAMRLDAVVCSSDSFPEYRSRYGFHFDPLRLQEARNHCVQQLRFALHRHVPVIVVDDANITAEEWGQTVFEAQLHQVEFVNFWCGSLDTARALLTRSFTHCSEVDREMLPKNYELFQEATAQLPRSHTLIYPVFNSWDDSVPTENRATQP